MSNYNLMPLRGVNGYTYATRRVDQKRVSHAMENRNSVAPSKRAFVMPYKGYEKIHNMTSSRLAQLHYVF